MLRLEAEIGLRSFRFSHESPKGKELILNRINSMKTSAKPVNDILEIHDDSVSDLTPSSSLSILSEGTNSTTSLSSKITSVNSNTKIHEKKVHSSVTKKRKEMSISCKRIENPFLLTRNPKSSGDFGHGFRFRYRFGFRFLILILILIRIWI